MSPVVSLACTEVACFQSEQFARELSRSLDVSEFVSVARQFACYQMSFFTVCSAWSWWCIYCDSAVLLLT